MFAITLHPQIIEKLQSKGVARHVYIVSIIYDAYTGSQSNGRRGGAIRNIEQGSNFIVDNDSRLLFDTQEAYRYKRMRLLTRVYGMALCPAPSCAAIERWGLSDCKFELSIFSHSFTSLKS